MLKKTISFLTCIILMLTCVASIAKANETKYLYDNKGQLAELASSEGTIEYQYDEQGNLLRKNKTNNLLVNSSFKQITEANDVADTWMKQLAQDANNEFVIVKTPKNVQKISGSGIKNWDYIGIYQQTAVLPNRPINVNARINVEKLQNARVYLYVDYMTAEGKYTMAPSTIAEYNYPTNGGYITLAGSGTVPSNAAYARVYAMIRSLGDGGSGTIYVDSMRLWYGEENLLNNNELDSKGDVADAWTKWLAPNASNEFAIVKTPKNVQKISGSGIKNWDYIGIYQETAVLPNRPINVNARINVEKLQNARVYLYVDYMTAEGKYTMAPSTIADYNYPTNGGYITITGTGTVPSNAAYARVYAMIRSLGDEGSGTIYVDSMRLWYGEENLLNNNELDGKGDAADTWVKWLAPNASNEFAIVKTPTNVQKISGSGIKNWDYIGIYQETAVLPNRPINVNARINVEKLQNARVYLYVDYMTAEGKYTMAPSTIAEYDYPTNGGYITIAGTGTVPSNAAYARVYAMIRSLGDGGSGTIYVDSMRLWYGEENLLNNNELDGKGDVADTWVKWLAPNASNEFAIVKTSKNVQKISGSGIKNWDYIGIYQETVVLPNRPINVNARINVEKLQNARVYLYVDYMTAEGKYTMAPSTIAEYDYPTNGGYITITGTGTVPSNAAYARVYAMIRSLGDEGSGTIYVDSMRLWYGEENLLNNNEFDGNNRVANNWEEQVALNATTDFEIITTPQGSKVQKIFGPGLKNGSYTGIWQDTTVSPGQKLQISGKINVENLQNARVQLYVDYMTAEGKFTMAPSTIAEYSNPTNGGYITITGKGSVPSNAAYARVNVIIRALGDNGTGKVYVDSVRLCRL